MLSRSVKLVLSAVVGAFLISGAVSAATIPISPTPGGPYALVAGNEYFDTQLFLTPTTAFDKQYDFTAVTPPTLNTTTEVRALTIIGPVANLKIEWFNAALATIGVLVVTDATGAEISPGALLLVAILTTGNYFLHVTGATLATGAGYVLGVDVVGTPLPPALILFLSALVGLGILGRRRRSTGPGLAA